MKDLQVTITHTPTLTTAVERYVSNEPYIRKALALTWEDINFKASEISINKALEVSRKSCI